MYLPNTSLLVWWYWRRSDLRWDRSGRFSRCCRPVVLAFLSVLLMPHTRRAAHCTASRRLRRLSLIESHAEHAYSNTGLMSCLYAFPFTFSEVVRTFQRMKPGVLLAFVAMLFTWGIKCSFWVKSNSRDILLWLLLWSLFRVMSVVVGLVYSS